MIEINLKILAFVKYMGVKHVFRTLLASEQAWEPYGYGSPSKALNSFLKSTVSNRLTPLDDQESF